jgi:excinuclease ABC subunit A
VGKSLEAIVSGGEAQRLKVARELAASRAVARRLYILDEPTVGLGVNEVGRLVDVLEELVEAGGSVLVVEHNLDVIGRADWVIDLGPGAAASGGRLVAEGPPETIAASDSPTGRYLSRYLETGRLPSDSANPAGTAGETGSRPERAG